MTSSPLGEKLSLGEMKTNISLEYVSLFTKIKIKTPKISKVLLLGLKCGATSTFQKGFGFENIMSLPLLHRCSLLELVAFSQRHVVESLALTTPSTKRSSALLVDGLCTRR